MRSLKNNKKGFTIIEVLIVLAIAGVIILIMLLAVPALQRNSRNTQRRSDVSKMAGLLQEAINNNNGTNPASLPNVISEDSYGQYTSGDINYSASTSSPVTFSVASTTLNTVYLRNGLKCNNNGANAYSVAPAVKPPISTGTDATNIVKATGATLRNWVIVWAVESTSGNIQLQCSET